jgi:hypothetical protein
MKTSAARAVIILCAIALAGCATPQARTSGNTTFSWTSPNKRVVLVAPDVELTELTAGGVNEPRADWTEAARGFIGRDVTARLSQKTIELVNAPPLTPQEVQITRLHAAVGKAIMRHLFVPVLQLPNKQGALDWTLGAGTNEMRDRLGADYALFVFVRDSYSSSGRQALQILGVLAGVAVPGGAQIGFASLVDLRTGNIVWFNRLVSTSGDLRTEAPAQKTVDALLKDIPI